MVFKYFETDPAVVAWSEAIRQKHLRERQQELASHPEIVGNEAQITPPVETWEQAKLRWEACHPDWEMQESDAGRYIVHLPSKTSYYEPSSRVIGLGASDGSFDQALLQILQELQALMLRKHEDYGPLNIALAPGGALNGLRVRLHDKLARINNLYDSDRDPNNESIEDSFLDLANYGIIGLMVLRGQWPGTRQ